MTKQPIDTTKEVKFYVSGVMPAGALIFSLIFGFGAVLSLFAYDYHSLHLDLLLEILVLLVCLTGVMWSVYMALSGSLLLVVNEKGIFAPSIGRIQWDNIKGIHVGSTDINGYPTSFNIILSGGVSHKLGTLLFSIPPYDLLEILRTYQGSMPPGSNRASLLK